jgi:uncharacterized NAD-dependent epimerase/dehydratase family protein
MRDGRAAQRLLVLADGVSHDPHDGKTAHGLARYAGQSIVALVDAARPGDTLHDVPIVGSLAEGLALAPTTAVVGIAPDGGVLPPGWEETIAECLRAGLDVESGLHEFLADRPALAELAERHGGELRDLRRPPAGLTIPTGAGLGLDAEIVLTVGSDCSIGKMTVSLELDRLARARGVASCFVPTGQTGIAIGGWGISVDAVVSDFLAGAAERLVLEGHARGGRLLMVEGQGSLIHPAYAGVTLGLLHGAAPHQLILCHRPGQREILGHRGHPLRPLPELVELYERSALTIRPARVSGVALNTVGLSDAAARAAVEQAEAETGLPADDPVRFGPERLLDAVLAARGSAPTPPAAP